MLWELVLVEPAPRLDLPKFLGCQSAIAVWPREVSGPQLSSKTASSIAVFAPGSEYADVLVREMRRIDVEAQFLASRYGAHRINARESALRREQEVHILHVIGRATAEISSLAAAGLVSSSFVFLSTDDAAPLAEELLAAGASAVVAPMWPVPDEEAGEFVTNFYERVLERGVAVAEVLRQLRCMGGPEGSSALAYRLFGPTDYRLHWRPSAS